MSSDGLPRGQLLDESGRSRRARPRRSIADERVEHVVLDQPAHPAELAQRVEVADQRHPRVGGLAAVLLVAASWAAASRAT